MTITTTTTPCTCRICTDDIISRTAPCTNRYLPDCPGLRHNTQLHITYRNNIPYTAEGWELEILPHGWSVCNICDARDQYIHNNTQEGVSDK